MAGLEKQKEEKEVAKQSGLMHKALEALGRWENESDGDGDDLRRWLSDEPAFNFSASQMGFHLALQVAKNPGSLGEYFHWSLRTPEKREERVRNLFPLPLWLDSRMQLREVLEEGTALDRPGKWRERGDTRSSAQKMKRVEGLKVWHGLLVISLNYLYGERKADAPPLPGGQATEAQEKALTRLWNQLKIFLDEKGKKGVPRTPMAEWKHTIGDLSVSYTGEIVEKAAKLSLRQILPGLPSPEHGGMVDLLEVVPESIAARLKDPESMVKCEFPDPMPKPRVLCEPQEWQEVVKAMYERGLVKAATSIPTIEGQRVVNGAFGVPKAGRHIESGEEVLRLIMDLRATNWMMEQLEADTATLTGAATFQRVVVENGMDLLVSGEDLTSAFYLFRLPPEWTNLMVLDGAVPGEILGKPEAGLVHAGLCVLPMGWHSSVGIMQAAHRRIALGSPLRGGAGLGALAEIQKGAVFPDLDEGPGWSIYLDDTTILEKVCTKMASEMVGKEAAEQEQLRRAYAWWGIPTNADKSLKRQPVAERLGAVLDGKAGVLRASTVRCLEVLSLGSWIRAEGDVPRKALQIYAGKMVHILQFRRCMFSYLEEIFAAISQGPNRVHVTGKLRNEMMALEMGLPLAQFNMRAAIDPVVTCSDACESGGGICVSSRLSRAGKEEVEAMLEGSKLEKEKPDDPTKLAHEERVAVIDLFSGIGGLTNALEKAGALWSLLICVEKDKDCRRLLRRVYPGAEFISDVKDLDEKTLRRLLGKVPDLTGIVVGGGSPCQGLSKLKSQRKHLQDERSGLFYEVARIFQIVPKLAKERSVWMLKLLENVIADARDIKEMSFELDIRPVMVDAQYLSRARRPRLFWISVALSKEEDVEVIEREHFDQVIYRADPEPMELFLEKDHDWAAGLRDPNLKFPTFTRAIRRMRPPPDPVGLEGLGDVARIRWEEDSFRYPPYTYKDDYMILTPACELRPLVAAEREILMGFPQGHVNKLLKKTPQTQLEKREAEDLQCSALGNSFHTNSVACLLDHALASLGLKSRKGAKEIVACSMAAQVVPPKEVEEEKEGAESVAVKKEPRSEDETISVPGNEMMENLEKKSRSASLNDELQSDERLSQLLISAYVRRQEFKGSDVRLDIGCLYRPDAFPRASLAPGKWHWHVAHHWPFKMEEHINLLELRALIHTFEWRLRKSSFGDVRALHLCDSQVALSVAVKGRSSSRQINRLLKKYAALQLAGGILPLLAWVESELNPSDAPSRYYEKK